MTIRATTSTLAMYETYRRHGWTNVGVVCPYTDDLTAAIVAEYARCGFPVAATANLGLTSNIDMGNVPASVIREQLAAVAAAKPDCIAVICTNLSAIPFTAAFEDAYGIPIVDSIAATFVEVSRLCGIDVRLDGLGCVLGGGASTSSP
jgi:maleate isomerase